MKGYFVFLALHSYTVGFAQVPRIEASGLVSAATYTAPVAPGSLAALFGENLATSSVSAPSVPLPRILGGVQVLIGGRIAPLLYVSPNQINFQVPANTPVGHVPLVVSGLGGSSESVNVLVVSEVLGVFVRGEGRCGPGAILGMGSTGQTVVNSQLESAEPGDWISVFGTGGGVTYFPPGDGNPAPGIEPLSRHPIVPTITVGTGSKTLWPRRLFFGLAPGLVGVDQLVFQLPMESPEDCQVPLRFSIGDRSSQPVSISVKSGGGKCTPSELVGLASLVWTRTTTSGPAVSDRSTVEEFIARFSQGGRSWLAHPSPQRLVQTSVIIPRRGPECGAYIGANIQAGNLTLLTGQPIPSLSPVRSVDHEFLYRATVPDGTMAAGRLRVSAAGSPEVPAFMSELAVPPPIRIRTDLKPGTVIDSRTPFRIDWEGGRTESVVTLQVVSITEQIDALNGGGQVSVRGEEGSAALRPIQFSGGGRYYFPTRSGPVTVIVRVTPMLPTPFGQTVDGRHEWEDVYEFRGLTLSP